MHLAAAADRAYWRATTPVEAKLNFAEIDADEAFAVGRSSAVFGVILAAQMGKFIDWASRASTIAALRDAPLFLADDIGAELTRLFARSYFDGALGHAEAMRRQDKTEGRAPRMERAPVFLSEQGLKNTREQAHRLALDIVRGIAKTLAPVWESAFAPDGRRTKSAQDIANEIRSIYLSKYIEPTETVVRLAVPRPKEKPAPSAKPRRMKVRDRAAYEKWQASRLPYPKWIKEELAKDARKAKLKLQQEAMWLQTERTRYYAHGAIAAAIQDPETVTLTYSAIRDSKTCAMCVSLDGITRPKGDRWWGAHTPPMHHGCRCNVVPATRAERVKITPRAQIDVEDDAIAPGFGMYNPAKVKSAKRLAIAGPKAKGYTRAIRIAQGRTTAPPIRVGR